MIADPRSRLDQNSFGSDIRMRTNMVEQPDQLQLRIRLGISP
jgi:hypothetical protein